jgi:hypothetical protein
MPEVEQTSLMVQPYLMYPSCTVNWSLSCSFSSTERVEREKERKREKGRESVYAYVLHCSIQILIQ